MTDVHDGAQRPLHDRDFRRERAMSQPVEVTNEEPLQVEVTQSSAPAPAPVVTPSGGLSLPPTTTEQEDRVTEGQRHINVLWESSQSVISIAITVAVIYCQINAIQSETLNNAFFFVVATYLQRTNHVRIGGTGPKANEPPYRGR